MPIHRRTHTVLRHATGDLDATQLDCMLLECERKLKQLEETPVMQISICWCHLYQQPDLSFPFPVNICFGGLLWPSKIWNFFYSRHWVIVLGVFRAVVLHDLLFVRLLLTVRYPEIPLQNLPVNSSHCFLGSCKLSQTITANNMLGSGFCCLTFLFLLTICIQTAFPV